MPILELQRLGVRKRLDQETRMAEATEQKLGCSGQRARERQGLSQVSEKVELAN